MALTVECHADGSPKVYRFGLFVTGKRRSGFEQRIVRALREYCRLSQRNRCYHCGEKMTDNEGDATFCTLDHMRERSKDGELSPANCVAACVHCNSRRSNGGTK